MSLALRHLRAVAGTPSRGAGALPSALRRLDPDARAAKVVELAPSASWEGRLASDLSTAGSAWDRVDTASEAVGELAALYASRSRWSMAAVRIEVAFALMAAALLFADGERLLAGTALGVGAFAAVLTHLLGGLAAQRERAQRSLADEIVLLLVGEVGPPSRPKRRR